MSVYTQLLSSVFKGNLIGTDMSLTINSNKYYRTAEACRLAGISKMSYLRWVRQGQIPDVSLRDRRGWRLFSEDDLLRLELEANRISEVCK